MNKNNFHNSQPNFELKAYARGKVFFKLGVIMVMVMPPSIFYYKKHQKDLWARSIVKDMKRVSESGKSMHDIPRYDAPIQNEKGGL